MKILYHHRIASKDGQYVHVEEIIRSFRKLGHEVIIVAPGDTDSRAFGESSRSVDWLRASIPGSLLELVEFAYCLLDAVKLAAAVCRHRPDFIYERYNLFFVSGIWVKRLFRVPLLLEVNAPLFAERCANQGIHLRRLARWSEGYAWRGADHVFPVTRVLADRMVEAGVPETRLTVIHNGVSEAFLNATDQSGLIDKQYGLEGKLVIGFTGFVRSWHGLDRVLEVLADHPDENWHLLLVGDGPDRERLERIAGELGVRERFTVTGVVSRDELIPYVQRFDIAVQPDVVPYASPLKLFEYLALGKAILAPDSANIREILVDGESAVLFDDGDGDAFKRGLVFLAADARLQKNLEVGAAQLIVSRGFLWDCNARRIVETAS